MMMGAAEGEMRGAFMQADAAHETLGLEALQKTIECGGVAGAANAFRLY